MNNFPSKPWVGAGVAVVALLCLVVFTVAAVPAAGAQQSGASEEEIEARVRAELQARLAQMTQRLQELEARRAMGMSQVQSAARSEEALRRALAEVEGAMQRARAGVSTFRLRGGCESFGDTVLDYAEELSLSDDQLAGIRDAQRATRRQEIERNADIEVGEMDLDALYETDDLDLGAIRAQLEELARLGVDNQMAGLTLRQQVNEFLTPEQREQLEDLRGDRDYARVVVSGVGTSGWRVGRIGC